MKCLLGTFRWHYLKKKAFAGLKINLGEHLKQGRLVGQNVSRVSYYFAESHPLRVILTKVKMGACPGLHGLQHRANRPWPKSIIVLNVPYYHRRVIYLRVIFLVANARWSLTPSSFGCFGSVMLSKSKKIGQIMAFCIIFHFQEGLDFKNIVLIFLHHALLPPIKHFFKAFSGIFPHYFQIWSLYNPFL